MVEQKYPSVLVTGGGSGIGAAIARQFAQMNYRVHVAGRRPEPLAAVAADIAAQGGEAHVHIMDICDTAAVDAVITQIDDSYGGLSVLVANAGVAAAKPMEETDDNLLQEILAINVREFACCTIG